MLSQMPTFRRLALSPSSGHVWEMTKFADIYQPVLPVPPPYWRVIWLEDGVRLCGQSSHFGYRVTSLNLEHDLLSLVLYLPTVVGFFFFFGGGGARKVPRLVLLVFSMSLVCNILMAGFHAWLNQLKNRKIANISLESVTKFKHLAMAVTNQNYNPWREPSLELDVLVTIKRSWGTEPLVRLLRRYVLGVYAKRGSQSQEDLVRNEVCIACDDILTMSCVSSDIRSLKQ
jgi:hypothetical protein